MTSLPIIHNYNDTDEWVLRHLHLCDIISPWSKDPSSKFGCVITDELYRPIGYGVNGFPRGFEDLPERWNDRPFKYEHVIHAEENALLNSVIKPDGGIAFVSACPCSGCMGKLAQSQIREVWAWAPTKDYLSRWSIEKPMTIAREVARKRPFDVHFVNRPDDPNDLIDMTKVNFMTGRKK